MEKKMKTSLTIKAAGLLLLCAPAFGLGIDTITVSGYLKKTASAAVTETTMDAVVGIVDSGTGNCVWAKKITGITVTNGYFSTDLTSTGGNVATDANQATLVATPGCAQDFSGSGSNVTINSTLLSGTTGPLVARVWPTTSLNSQYPNLTLNISATPVAMVADKAAGVKSSTAVTIAAGGANQNITLTPSGTGGVVIGTGTAVSKYNVCQAANVAGAATVTVTCVNVTAASQCVCQFDGDPGGGASVIYSTAGAGSITAGVTGTSTLTPNVNCQCAN